jgi:hypothetical protein
MCFDHFLGAAVFVNVFWGYNFFGCKGRGGTRSTSKNSGRTRGGLSMFMGIDIKRARWIATDAVRKEAKGHLLKIS